MKNYRFWMISMFLLLMSIVSFSQTPSHFPNPTPKPVDVFENTASFIFYVVIPVAIAILYFIWKRNTARQQKEQEGSEA